jgi:hypothetical protein
MNETIVAAQESATETGLPDGIFSDQKSQFV